VPDELAASGDEPAIRLPVSIYFPVSDSILCLEILFREVFGSFHCGFQIAIAIGSYRLAIPFGSKRM
jgi:hypothetical protein